MTAQLRTQFVQAAKSLFDRGYATGGAGNISVRTKDNTFLVTPTGSCLGRLQPDDLSLVTLNGELISGRKPSKEISFHLAVYREKSECNAIVHLHSTYLTALSCLKHIDTANAIQAFTPYYVMRIGELPIVPYFNPGDAKIGEYLSTIAKDYRAYLLANHGPVVTGKDLFDAVDNAEELEETAKLFFILRNSEINYISEADKVLLMKK